MSFRVMIVDDTAYMRAVLGDYLRKGKIIITGEAEDGPTAIQKYKHLQPDLTFLNLVMPGFGGIEVLRNIKEWDPNAKIVICSAITQANIMFDAIQAGAFDYVTKPFTIERVLSVVDRCKQLSR